MFNKFLVINDFLKSILELLINSIILNSVELLHIELLIKLKLLKSTW
jgi:hypothetical protein